jgi:hypothetical protein
MVDAVDQLALLTGRPCGVAESRIQLEGRVRAVHDIDGPDPGLRALEVPAAAGPATRRH